MIDFEQGMIATLNQEYPLVPQKVCLFHLSESLYQHVHELELSMDASGFLIAFRASHSFSKVYLRILNFYLMFYFETQILQLVQAEVSILDGTFVQSLQIYLSYSTEQVHKHLANAA